MVVTSQKNNLKRQNFGQNDSTLLIELVKNAIQTKSLMGGYLEPV